MKRLITSILISFFIFFLYFSASRAAYVDCIYGHDSPPYRITPNGFEYVSPSSCMSDDYRLYNRFTPNKQYTSTNSLRFSYLTELNNYHKNHPFIKNTVQKYIDFILSI